MTTQRLVVMLVCATLAIAPSAQAQNGSAPVESLVAPPIRPYVFVGPEPSPGVGAAVHWPLPVHLSLEFESTQRVNVRGANVSGANLRPTTANLSLLYDLPEVGRVTPYVAGGVGLRQYVIGDRSPTGLFVTRDSTAYSVNAGGGLKVRGSENWSMRTDARWSHGLGQSTSEQWSLFNGITLGRQGR